MKNYIKPTFTLAGLFPIALAAGSGCAVTSTELEEIFVNDFGWEYTDKALNSTDGCESVYPIDVYCKYTSADSGAIKVLGS